MVELITSVALLAGLGVLIVGCVLALLLARRVVRRYRRGVAQLRSRVLAIGHSASPLSVLIPPSPLIRPGPRRDVATLRRQLAAELTSTCDMIKSAPDAMIFRADASAVLREVTASVSALDTELAAIGRFPDPAQQRAGLAMVSPQVRQLVESMYTARRTLLRTAAEDRERALAALKANLDAQASALEVYQRGAGELTI
ncbi:MAG: hypothetical protein M3N95_15375 [Actinomycetota bacterium]|nr:hypothetical protein [Actinomycetota bacterium]